VRTAKPRSANAARCSGRSCSSRRPMKGTGSPPAPTAATRSVRQRAC
jgi:hypothetical protein